MLSSPSKGRYVTAMTNRSWVLSVAALGLIVAAGCGDSTGSGGGGNGGGGEGGAPADTEINGCKASTAEDMTGMASVELAWTLPHQKCIKVDAGTRVTWNVAPATFTTHPLDGGETPDIDDTALITTADQTGNTASVTFDEPGVYPYFCGIHFTSMQGVIYVE